MKTLEEILKVGQVEIVKGEKRVRVRALIDDVGDNGRHARGEEWGMEASLVPVHVETGQVELVAPLRGGGGTAAPASDVGRGESFSEPPVMPVD